MTARGRGWGIYVFTVMLMLSKAFTSAIGSACLVGQQELLVALRGRAGVFVSRC